MESFVERGKCRPQMHPASHQEETGNLVEKAQVKNNNNNKKDAGNTEGLLHGSAGLN